MFKRLNYFNTGVPFNSNCFNFVCVVGIDENIANMFKERGG